MPVRTYRLAVIAAALGLSSLAACEINNPAPAPVVVNPQPNPSVVIQPSPQPPAVVVTPQ
jgi:hypothetical protein